MRVGRVLAKTTLLSGALTTGAAARKGTSGVVKESRSQTDTELADGTENNCITGLATSFEALLRTLSGRFEPCHQDFRSKK